MWQMLVLVLMSSLHDGRGAPPSLRNKRDVETRYGGWRPILPGSPFFFGGARSLPIHTADHPHEPAAHENVHVNAPPPPPPQHQVILQPSPQHQISIEALRPLSIDGQHQINIKDLRPIALEGQHQIGIQTLPEHFRQQHHFMENKPEAQPYPQSPVPDKDIFSYYPPPTTPQPFPNHHQASNRPLYVEHAKQPFDHPFGKDVPVLEIGIQTPFKVLPVNVIGPHHSGENLAQSTMHGGAFHQPPQVGFHANYGDVHPNQIHVDFQQRFPGAFRQPEKPQDEFSHQETAEIANEPMEDGFKFQEGSSNDESTFGHQEEQVRFPPQQGIDNQVFMDEIRVQQIGQQNAFRPDDSGAYQLPQESEKEEDKFQQIREQSVFHSGHQVKPNDEEREEEQKPAAEGDHSVYEASGYHQEDETKEKEEKQQEDQQKAKTEDTRDYRPQVEPEEYPREEQHSERPEYVHFPGENQLAPPPPQLPPRPSPVYSPPTHHEYALPIPTYSQPIPQEEDENLHRQPQAQHQEQERFPLPQPTYQSTAPQMQEQEQERFPLPQPTYHSTAPHVQEQERFPLPQSTAPQLQEQEQERIPLPQPTYEAIAPPQPQILEQAKTSSQQEAVARPQQLPYHPQHPPRVYQNYNPPPVQSKRPTDEVQHQPSSTSYFTTFGSVTNSPLDEQIPSSATKEPPRVEALVAPPSFHVYGAPKKSLPFGKKESPPATTTTPKSKEESSEVIHMTPGNDKKTNGTQVYHAYYAPADHKAPPGYVRLTVTEFNKMFNNADIQYIGAEASQKKGNDDKPKVLLSGAPESNKVEEEATASDDDGPILTLDLKPGQSVEDALSELGTIDVGGVRVDASQLKEGRDFEVVDVHPVNGTSTTTTPKPSSLLVDDGHFGERIKKKKS